MGVLVFQQDKRVLPAWDCHESRSVLPDKGCSSLVGCDTKGSLQLRLEDKVVLMPACSKEVGTGANLI